MGNVQVAYLVDGCTSVRLALLGGGGLSLFLEGVGNVGPFIGTLGCSVLCL